MADTYKAADDEPLLSISGLTVRHLADQGPMTILDEIELSVARGETVGIVGESGSGKSMLAKAALRLLPRGVEAEGSITYDGHEVLECSPRQMTALRGQQMTLLYQDPFTILNPLLTAGGHIVEALRAGRKRAGRLSRQEAKRDAVRRLAEVGISDASVADRYPFQLSGGMRQRVALATALARDPALLIADEPSTALDVTTQAEILALLKEVQRARSMSLILITHDLRVAFSTCDRIYVLYAGSLVEVGLAADVEREPLHPYTQGLLLSEPAVDRRLASLTSIPGSVPRPDEVAGRCVFEPRCSWAVPACREARPKPVLLTPTRWSSCLRIEDIRGDLADAKSAAGGVPVVTHSSMDSGGTPLLVVSELRKEFGGRQRARTVALDGVGIRVGRGESVGLVGESGSGKTTLGRCVVGLETPTGGTITLDGRDAHDYAAVSKDARALLRRTAQMVFQDPYSSLDPRQTVRSMLFETLRVNGSDRRTAEARVPELIESVGLPASYGGRRPAALSGGERQRVAIARALAVDPDLIVCDEPVSALDVSVQAQVLTLLREIRDRTGVAYLFITHDLAVVRQIVDRVYVLHQGQVVEEGPVAEVLDRPTAAYTQKLVASVPGRSRDEASTTAGA